MDRAFSVPELKALIDAVHAVSNFLILLKYFKKVFCRLAFLTFTIGYVTKNKEIYFMVWGTFTITHILSLLLGAAITIGLYFALKHRTEKTQTIVLGILSFAGIAAIIFNLVV